MFGKESEIDWNNIIKKEATGKNDEDLGEVQDIGDKILHTTK